MHFPEQVGAVLLVVSCRNYLSALDPSPCRKGCIANIFSWSVNGLFIFLAEEMTFDDVLYYFFLFLIRAFCGPEQEVFSPSFSSRSSLLRFLLFKSVVHV